MTASFRIFGTNLIVLLFDKAYIYSILYHALISFPKYVAPKLIFCIPIFDKSLVSILLSYNLTCEFFIDNIFEFPVS